MNELIENNKLSLSTEKRIIEYKEKLKEIRDFEKKFNEELKKEMEAKGIIKYSDDNLSISYIDENEREDFDKDKFKENYPDVYKMFTKKTKVKSHVKVLVKKNITSENMKEIDKVEVLKIGINED